MKLFLDVYDRRARLWPALLSALPLAISLVPLATSIRTWWAATAPVLVYCGGAYLLTQLVRDRGKALQPRLWDEWGGAPTTRLLRHREGGNAVLIAHRHGRLAQLLPHLTFPTAAEELADPRRADDVYETATDYLRGATRDVPLVFKENCNYGFRRNLLALRPWGIGLTVLGMGAVLGTIAGEMYIGMGTSTSSLCAGAVDVLALAVWIFAINSSWVRIVANEYAERLLGAADQIKVSGSAG